MTLDDYAYEIMELVYKELTDDISIDIRLVKDLIIEQRELDIYRRIAKYGASIPYSGLKNYAQFTKETFVEQIAVQDIINCGTINNSWLISSNTQSLNFIERLTSPIIFFLIKVDGTNDLTPRNFYDKIEFVSSERAIYIGNGRFNSNQKLAFYIDGKVIITSKDSLFLSGANGSEFFIYAVLKDPTSANGFNDSIDEFPIGSNWAFIQDYVRNKLIDKLKLPEDRINDASDQIKTKS